jgi:hypothetical protein
MLPGCTLFTLIVEGPQRVRVLPNPMNRIHAIVHRHVNTRPHEQGQQAGSR